MMRQAVTFRFDPELLSVARRCAAEENRTLTNFFETLLKRHIAARPNAAPRVPARRGEVRGDA